MGTYVFTWSGPASSVFVTGSFDNWQKVNELKNENGVFSKSVDLPLTDDLVHYKYVVDDKWVTDPKAPLKEDASGNLNNVLERSDITPHPAGTSAAPVAAAAGAAGASAVAAGAAGAAIAHHSKSDSSDMPGAFPETPAEKDQIFSVNPLPPSGGLGNPKPGEVNTNTLTSHVTLDKESYEKGGALGSSNANAIEASGGAFGVPPVTNTTIPESSLPMGAGGARDPGLPTISSTAGPNTTTSALAGQVPLEPRGVPEVVSESQQRAHVDPEASADRDAVQHKEKVEQELQKKVPEESATSESTIAGKIGVVAAGAGGVVAAGAAAIGLTAGSQSAETKKEIASQGSATSGAQETQGVPPVVTESQNQAHASPEASGQPAVVAEKEQVEEELKKKVPEEPPSSQDNIGSKVAAGAAAAGAAVVGGAAAAGAYASSKLPASVQDSIPGTGAAPDTAKSVPSAVADSQHKAHASPEASSNAEAVTEKSAVEKELLSKVPTDNGTGVPAPTATASTSATAPGASVGDPVIADESTLAAIAVANRAPGTEPVTSAGGASALNASASQPAQSIATEAGQLSSTTQQPPAAAVTTPKKRATDSRDVSPMTRGDVSASQPSVTTGTATQSTPTKSTPGGTTTSTADSPASASTDAKKKNRRSFFGRIKDKLKDK